MFKISFGHSPYSSFTYNKLCVGNSEWVNDFKHSYSLNGVSVSLLLHFLHLSSDWLSVSQAQINLIGNPVSWSVANLSLLAYQLLAAVYLLRRRRGYKDLPDGTHTHTQMTQVLFVVFWSFAVMRHVGTCSCEMMMFLLSWSSACFQVCGISLCVLDVCVLVVGWWTLFHSSWWRKLSSCITTCLPSATCICLAPPCWSTHTLTCSGTHTHTQ